MDTQLLIEQAQRIISNIDQRLGSVKSFILDDYAASQGYVTEAAEFLRVYAGEKSAFFTSLKQCLDGKHNGEYLGKLAIESLTGYVRYLEAGLHEGVTPTRQAQLDTVSDFLDQARILLEQPRVHPAAPAVLIGASLEEFLRTWIENANISLGNKKPCLESYSQLLKENELITKQDTKDISSWGGLRNHAAHGEWDEVADRKRISIMLESVNLFMRKYSS
jgi:hypothetical protein